MADRLTLLETMPRTTRPLAVLPVPFDLSSDYDEGFADGPQCLLNMGLVEALGEAGLRVELLSEISASHQQLGITYEKSEGILHKLAPVFANIRDVVEEQVQTGSNVLTLGGEHAVAIGSVAGAAHALKGDLGVIWIDVHGDSHTWETSWSKNVHGMAAAALMGFGAPALTDPVQTKIQSHNMLYLGLRDLEHAELDFIRRNKIAYETMHDIAAGGIAPALARVVDLASRVNNVWISLDMDSIDQEYAPATAMATPGGFTYREITSLMTAIGKFCNVVGMDLVELTPEKDIDGKTAALCIELAAAAFGAKADWYSRTYREYLKSPLTIPSTRQVPRHP